MEGPKDRKARREAARREAARRQAQRRKLLLRLLAAAGVLLLCGGLLFWLSRQNGTPGGETTPSTGMQTASPGTSPSAPPTSAPENSLDSTGEDSQPPAQEPVTVIHLAAAGDLTACDRVVGTGDYDQALLDVLPLLSRADITALNFEGNAAGAPYGTATGSVPESLLSSLRRSGVDILQTANSYSVRNGIRGLEATLQAIRGAGMTPVGAYASNRDFQSAGGYTLVEVQGIRIAFVAFTKGMNGMALPEGNENCVNLLYTDYASTYQTIDREGITAVLRAAEEDDPDITVALLHWGSEYNDVISNSQKSIRDLMFAEGVDAIIGTHSHFVQAMELDKEKGTFVCYSLGDFFGEAGRAGADYSVVLDLEITRDNETGQTKVTDYSYTPIYTVAEGESCRVVRIREAMEAYELHYMGCVSQETYEDMAYALERIEDRVHPEAETSE